METYKKPVVASKRDPSSSTVMPMMEPPTVPTFLLKKLFGDDDFHAEKSLTVRKNIAR